MTPSVFRRRAVLVFVAPRQDRRRFAGFLGGGGFEAAVGGAGDFDQRRWDAAQLQGGVVLFGLAVGGAVVLFADHDHRRRRHVADQRERRTAPVVDRVFPRHFAEPVFGHEVVAVGGQHFA